MTYIPYLDDESPIFPPTANALSEEPNGLLAVGGNLEPQTLLRAYTLGIYPWFSPGEPILWWSPSPRMALSPSDAHFSRSLKKLARKQPFIITVDEAFSQVINQCSVTKRKDQQGTWISSEMQDAYQALHRLGYAHSIEAWRDGRLVGGLYGLAIGTAFFGESMFSTESGASKIAFASLCVQLVKWSFSIIDCQVHTPLLESFGASELERIEFETLLAKAIQEKESFNWKTHWALNESGYDGSY